MGSDQKDYMTESTFEEAKPELTVVVVDGCMKLNVREEPSLSGKIISVLNRGDILEKTNATENGAFSEVRLLTGQYGYAMTQYLKES